MRKSLCRVASLLLLISTNITFGANEETNPGFLFDAHVTLDQTCIRAIEKAQIWLAATQHADGSWNSRYGNNNVGVNSYAILALMVGGDVPGEGKYSKNIGLGIQYLLNMQQASGLICSKKPRGAMYEHALATLVLSEVYGMSSNPRLRIALIKAINLIVATQDTGGGWRYNPKIEPGDISITVMQVMALRSAAEAGIYIPKDTMDLALVFIRGCYIKDEHGFGYTGPGGGAAFPRTAAGVVSLQTLGLQEDPIIPQAINFIMKNGFDSKEKTFHESNFYWYGHYYSSVALYHYGGKQWKSYYPRIKKKILSNWKPPARYQGTLATAWGVMILGVPYRYLPIYQR